MVCVCRRECFFYFWNQNSVWLLIIINLLLFHFLCYPNCILDTFTTSITVDSKNFASIVGFSDFYSTYATWNCREKFARIFSPFFLLFIYYLSEPTKQLDYIITESGTKLIFVLVHRRLAIGSERNGRSEFTRQKGLSILCDRGKPEKRINCDIVFCGAIHCNCKSFLFFECVHCTLCLIFSNDPQRNGLSSINCIER